MRTINKLSDAFGMGERAIRLVSYEETGDGIEFTLSFQDTFCMPHGSVKAMQVSAGERVVYLHDIKRKVSTLAPKVRVSEALLEIRRIPFLLRYRVRWALPGVGHGIVYCKKVMA